MKKLFIILALTVVMLLAVGYFIPVSQVAYAKTVEYQDIERYYENESYHDTESYVISEPYEDTETYIISEPYQSKENYYTYEPILYNLLFTSCEAGKVTTADMFQYVTGKIATLPKTYYPVCRADLRNDDSVPGKFKITFTINYIPKFSYSAMTSKPFNPDSLAFSLFCQPCSKSCEVDIEQGSTKTTTINFYEIDSDDVYYILKDVSVVPSEKSIENIRNVTKYQDVVKTRPVTKYRDVNKTREITKTRQVEKQRPVTKQRIETAYKKVPLFELWFD